MIRSGSRWHSSRGIPQIGGHFTWAVKGLGLRVSQNEDTCSGSLHRDIVFWGLHWGAPHIGEKNIFGQEIHDPKP